ncbi:MAG: HNH endonuclease [Saprospiraceae bacterium]|nr:HNH endonuclease [Saprospiraceae bacterium]
MRPVDKGNGANYTNYQDAKQDLVNQLGAYCCYCERRIPTNIAVEHILPKDPALGYMHLRNNWDNFLLGCVNCNSAKSTKIIDLGTHLLPDRDNTFVVYIYEETGSVEINPQLDQNLASMATKTLDLVALNRNDCHNWDDTILFSALERFSQRVQAWVQAKQAREDYDRGQVNIRRICAEAASTGFFSIWMAAFEGISAVRLELIRVFPNTAPDCFDQNGEVVSPRPRNRLQNSGKS